MKLTCEKNILQEAISISQKAVTGKSTMPILQGILINAKNDSIIFTGSDIDLSIETKINANIYEEGSIVVDSKIFGEIIRKLPNDTIEISTKDNNVIEIICQKSNFTLIHMDSSDFPELPNINENSIFSIPQKILKSMIKSTIFATAQEETRPILTGVLFEIKDKKLNLVALDGYRLAIRSEYIDNENSINAVIPGKTLNEVAKILEDTDENVNITFTPNHILFSIGETKIISRLLEGEFIKYNSIIPEEYNLKIIAKRNELLNCIERASLMGKEGNTSLIRLNIEDDNMIITSNSQLGMVREEVGIILQGQSLQIAFNSKYLIDVFKIMEDEEISMELSSSVSPCVIKSNETDNCTYLVLPVRLLNN
ncbi:DNA polymerase-3 subunit beta [Clostridium tetanomorphum]|uniref:Beta sliding clamp n=1 Tax=Clostridium tetanomorphum TaxID=1553 RepID=A0A923J1C1_CLOTT|nr:DNA polymerase III subunit beta [Clostridium tetanomorphum]KAJ49570.1 DNA polymerase III subunit beta [Clostridium tetanomorphum DSM 665]KAJ50011.1 DNA polymerase III subunit beta [Clostridium tetanomorphum DSM 665]MBC2399012.1 DNA polymerase III subunit beta [Clostridium tetanomorphum]MBP1866219.1 DNA polymerase-3 subunit beta [Clostridium tetanomorphum]NRS86589.1 DNA polymerase-3 subunit beta [Clostridium tetanomorphum]